MRSHLRFVDVWGNLSFIDEKIIREIDEANQKAYVARTSQPREVLVQATGILERSRAIGYRKGEGHALRTIASVTVKTTPQAALPLVNEAIEILEEVGDQWAVGSAKMTLFCYYHHVGFYLQGFNVLQDAYEQAERVGNTFVACMSLYNMGVSCEERADFDAATEYFEKCREMSHGEENAWSYWSSVAAVSRLKSFNNPSDEVIQDLIIAQEECERLGYMTPVLDILTSLAMCYGKRNRLPEATLVARQAKQKAFQLRNEPAYATMLLEWGEICARHQLWPRALRTFKRTLEYAKQTEYLMIEGKANEKLAYVYQQMGDFQRGMEHLYEHIRIKEQLQSKLLESRMQDMQSHHKIEMAQQEAERATLRSNELTAINEELHIALEQQAHLQRELMRLASTDDLTGALNRRQVINDGILEMERYRHMSAPFSVTLIDIDHFKSINDTFGHAAGDEILRRLSNCCITMIRKFDVFGRLGGEEFCIIHHDTDTAGAAKAVERLMSAISQIDVADVLGDRKLTVSMGISEVHTVHNTFYDVLHDADMALYDAKHAGRNNFKIRNSRQIDIARPEAA
jgi:two-component system, cell cycle response regulator